MPPTPLDPTQNTHSLPTKSIFLTGFDKFSGTTHGSNPSFLTVSSLPNSLYYLSPSLAYRARLFVYPAPLRVSYSAVQELIPQIYSSGGKYDYAIHVGQAPGPEFRLEKSGCRECNNGVDVDRRRRNKDAEPGYWSKLPERMSTSVDADKVMKKWKGAVDAIELTPGVKGVKVVDSQDAGLYLCDYVYYSSLAYFKNEETEGRSRGTKVVFLHVPPENDKATVERNRRVLEELIHAIVQVDGEEKDGKPV